MCEHHGAPYEYTAPQSISPCRPPVRLRPQTQARTHTHHTVRKTVGSWYLNQPCQEPPQRGITNDCLGPARGLCVTLGLQLGQDRTDTMQGCPAAAGWWDAGCVVGHLGRPPAAIWSQGGPLCRIDRAWYLRRPGWARVALRRHTTNTGCALAGNRLSGPADAMAAHWQAIACAALRCYWCS